MELPADIIDDDSPTPTLVGVGDVIAGKYEVERVIGEGGMGVVVAAMHVDLQERVAIKLMLPSLVGHPESAQRFAREARATFGIKSEHVARLFDFGKLADGSPFMVMEYLEGETLAAQLNRSTHVDITRAVDIVLEACVGVADAHRLGIIHRDLKPENLFLAATADERVVVKVLDFGISKANLKELSPTRTEGGMGTPAYAAPEQLRCAGDAGPCADIWSMGVVLFELLAGRLPFLAGSFAEMCAAVLTQRPPHPREIRADIPEALDAIVMRCLEVEPEARYQSIVELARALGPFASIDGKALVARLESRSSRSGESSSDRIPLTTLLGGARVVPLPDTQEAPPGDTAADAASGQGATTGAPDAGEEPRPLDDSLVGCAADSLPVPVLTRTRLRIVAARRASLLAAAAAALVLLGGALMGPDGDGDVSALAAASTLDAGPHRPRGDASDRVTSDQVLATERLLQENAVLQQEGRQARRDDQPSALERTIAEDGRDVASGGDVPADDGAAADAAAPPAPPSAPSSVVDPGPAPKSTAPRAVRSDGPTGRRAPRAVPVFDGFGGRK